MLLKRLYITNGPVFGNKLQTINSLIDARHIIDIPEIVFPEKLAVVDSKIVGYVMELVDSVLNWIYNGLCQLILFTANSEEHLWKRL